MGEQVPWPSPPRETGPWNGGPPVAPPGNTPLPPLPGAGGVVHNGAASTSPWAAAGVAPVPPPTPKNPPSPGPAPFPGLPNGPKLVDRAPAWLMAVSVLIVVAVVSGALFVVLKGGRQYPSEWDARVKPIADWVEDNRKLEFEHPVEVKFLSPAEYTKASTGDDSVDAPDEGKKEEAKGPSQESKDQAAELRALGFLSGDVDLDAAGKALSDSGTLAFYSPDEKKVYVRGTKMTPGLRVTLAHELTHVLQDQHFDLTRVSELPDSQGTVLRALAEGDAERIEDVYVEEELTDAERKAYETQSTAEGTEAKTKLKAKVPPILETFFSSPYILGPTFIEYLTAQGGDKAIDGAFTDVPSEEELLNPLIYDKAAADPVEVKVEPPADTKKLDGGEFGPTAWYLLLASRSSPAAALKAVDGWAGDAYVVAREGGKVCVSADVTGDTPAKSKVLADALTAWAAKSPAGSAKVTTSGDTAHFHACDPGVDAKAAGTDVTSNFLVVPVTRTQVYNQVLDDGGTEKQATCFGDRVATRFSVAQLTSPTFLSSPAGQQAIAGIRSVCL